MSIVANHAKITYKILLEFGFKNEKASELSHAASVVADHPKVEALLMNNIAAKLLNEDNWNVKGKLGKGLNAIANTSYYNDIWASSSINFDNGIFTGIGQSITNTKQVIISREEIKKGQFYKCGNGQTLYPEGACKIDYTRTKNSQEATYIVPMCDIQGDYTKYSGEDLLKSQQLHHENYNIWHSMRSPQEKQAFDEWGNNTLGISADNAMLRGMKYGWGKVFASAGVKNIDGIKENTNEYFDFGQGIHALQDAIIHKGGALDEHNKLDLFVHIIKDLPTESSVFNITRSAVAVHCLLNNQFEKIIHSNYKIDSINRKGISPKQEELLLSSLSRFKTYKAQL